MTDMQDLRRRLREAGQEHLLKYQESLTPREQETFVLQVAELDLGSLGRLVREYVIEKPGFTLPPSIEPAKVYSRDGKGWDVAAARARGEALLRAGKVAAFTVAGGQGSRLGFEGPKGCFPAGAISRKSLFQFFAESLLAAGRRYGRPIPWAIMTSPQNHRATIAYFREHHSFGLDEADIRFFPQGTMPSFDIRTGRVLMASRHEIAANPDGHGGAVRALAVSGTLDAFRERGVEHLSYFQVDNPIVRIADPVFLGLHAGAPDSSGEMSSKMVPKAYPEEKLGVFCRAAGKTCVIEYSDLPRALQEERLKDGSLRFSAGSVAIHAMGLAFLERVARESSLPYHRAEKKVACIDPESGERVEPKEPNAVKLERFIFDALGLCEASIVYETERVEEFAPIKNAEGVDSPASSAAVQSERAARWLASVGVAVPRKEDGAVDAVLEISPLTALEAADLAGKSVRIAPGERVLI